MADPYIGEIRMFGGNFAPEGWALCNGQLLSISDNETLFVLLGTTYGGDGQSTFALPNLQGRLPVHQGNGFTPGQSAGAETVTLTTSTIPNHAHALIATSSSGQKNAPASSMLATSRSDIYTAGYDPASMSNAALGRTGGSQPHDNMQPYLAVNFIIALQGFFPS